MLYGLLSKMLEWMDGVNGVDTPNTVFTTGAPAVPISGTSNLDRADKFLICSRALLICERCIALRQFLLCFAFKSSYCCICDFILALCFGLCICVFVVPPGLIGHSDLSAEPLSLSRWKSRRRNLGGSPAPWR